MTFPSDLTDDQWDIREPLLVRPGKPGSAVVERQGALSHTRQAQFMLWRGPRASTRRPIIRSLRQTKSCHVG